MMRYYQEITLLPNPEVGLNFLWSKVFQQLHLGFVENQQNGALGLSFPAYSMEKHFGELGNQCRLFAEREEILEQFLVRQRLERLLDYVHCTGVRPVPEKISGYAVYKRFRPKGNPERLARRYAKRHGLTEDQAWSQPVQLKQPTDGVDYPTSFRYCDMEMQAIRFPFVRLKSLSKDQTFCLWIEKQLVTEPQLGDFGTYGLSSSGSVPEF